MFLSWCPSNVTWFVCGLLVCSSALFLFPLVIGLSVPSCVLFVNYPLCIQASVFSVFSVFFVWSCHSCWFGILILFPGLLVLFLDMFVLLIKLTLHLDEAFFFSCYSSMQLHHLKIKVILVYPIKLIYHHIYVNMTTRLMFLKLQCHISYYVTETLLN